MEWWEVIYSNEWLGRFRNLAQRRLASSSSVDEAVEDVRQELALKLGQMSDPPRSIASFLRTAFRNALEDYVRKREGFPRPPRWIQKLGGVYTRVYRLLCLENRALEEIHALLGSAYRCSRAFVDQVVREIRAGVPNCGAWRQQLDLDDAQAELDERGLGVETSSDPPSAVSDAEAEGAARIILGLAQDSEQSAAASALLADVRQRIALSDGDRLLLRLVFTEGYSVSEAARALQLPDARVRTRLQRLLGTLRDIFQELGLSLDDLVD